LAEKRNTYNFFTLFEISGSEAVGFQKLLYAEPQLGS
jgi:hypothetical protein